MDKQPLVFIRLMNEAILGIDPSSLKHLKVGTEWVGIQILTDPFVIYRNDKYLAVVPAKETDAI